MYSTDLDGVTNSSFSTGDGSDQQATQPASESDANRFAQLMSENPQIAQGNQPPPPPPSQSTDDADELDELDSSESFNSTISQLMATSQPMDLSSIYDSENSSLLSDSFDDYSS